MVCHNSLLFYKKDKKQVIFEYTKEQEAIRSFSTRSDGYLGCFSNSSGYVKVFNLKHKSLLKSFKFSSHPVFSVTMAPKRSILIAGDDGGNFKALDYAAEMDLFTSQKLHSDFIRSLLFLDEDKGLVLTGGYDKRVCLVDFSQETPCELFRETSEISHLVKFGEHQVLVASNADLSVWDLRSPKQAVSKQLVANKAITSVFVNDGKIITSSFDQQLKIFDFNFQLINQVKFESPILQFRANPSIKFYCVSLQNRSVKIYSKSEEEKTDEQELDPEVLLSRDLLKKLYHGVGVRDESSYKFFQRGIWDKPEDFNVKIGKPIQKSLQSYDKLLRKFQYGKALAAVLQSKNTVQILSLVEELMIRGGLENAIKNLNQEDTVSLLDFCLKKIDSLNSQHLIVELLEVFFEHLPGMQKSREISEKVRELERKLREEERDGRECEEVLRMVEGIIN